MWPFIANLGKQVLLGVGMAAGQAIVETGQQVTINALQKKMAEWGVGLDSDSVLGMFAENLKSNLGFQTSYLIMNATDKIMDSQLDKLAELSKENERKISETIQQKTVAIKNKFNNYSVFSKAFWRRNPLDTSESSVNTACQSIAQDDINVELAQERARLQEEGKRFLEHRKTTGAMFNGLAVGSGTINTSNNHGGFSDDTKIFDAVMMMMNMKKVG